MLLTFKIQINLSDRQQSIINSMSNDGRMLYNHFLRELKEQYEKDKTFISYYKQQKELKDYKCGSINHDLDLSDRQYICDCGNDLNRDINGAINIYKQFMGDYNPPFETLVVSERFDWDHINQMNRNYKFYN